MGVILPVLLLMVLIDLCFTRFQVAREARQEYLQLVDDLRYQRNEYEQGGHPDVLRMLESLGKLQ